MSPSCPGPADLASATRKEIALTDWTDQTARARAWFESLRDRICGAFEAIEAEAGSDALFLSPLGA
jgi:hypothetical protein